MTYVCLECRETFSEPETWYEERGEHFGSRAFEKMSGCPYCGGDYTEAYICDYCDEPITTDKYVQIDDKKYCEDCFIIRDISDY